MNPTSAWHIQLFSLAASAPIRWRLLSGNNRDMGRSLDEYDDVESCRVALKQLQVDAADLVPRVRRLTPSSWQWEITYDELAIAELGPPVRPPDPLRAGHAAVRHTLRHRARSAPP